MLQHSNTQTNNNNSMYSVIRKPYVLSEFIPSSIVPMVIQHHFPSAELMLSYNENHGLYKIMVKDMLSNNIKNWDYNREPDRSRCEDIARYVYKCKQPIDTMFYLSFTNCRDKFEVIDGIHRLTALKFIKAEQSKPIDLLCPGEFGSPLDSSWLYDQYLTVNIRFNATRGEITELFTSLNKSQAVPELFLRGPTDENREKIMLINNIATAWTVKYKRNFSSSANPIAGNTNRDKFVELLDKLYDKHNIDISSGHKLEQLLENANYSIGQNIPSKVGVSTRLKCKETGCYLFIYKNDKLERMI